MKNRLKSVLILALICCFALSGCSDYTLNSIGAAKYDVTVQGAVFSGSGDDQVKTTVSFDPKWVTKNDNTKYNKDLAAFAAMLCDDVYFRTKDAEKGTPNRVLYEGETAEEYDWTNFLRQVGFSEVKYIESYKEKEYSGDSNDSATLLLAHGKVNGKYDLYTVVLRGCFSAQEWVSTFDPGCAGEAYTVLTGEHPEWKDSDSYKGFDIAKNRALEFVDEFISENNDPEFEDRILITGHSRGGAIANMIGAEMENRQGIKSYTYTFSAPGVTVNESAKDYRTIFNVFDSNDYYIDPMPFGKERFFRYGVDLTLPVASSDEVRTEIAKLKGRDDFASLTPEAKSEFAALFGARFPDRDSLYEMKTVTQTFDTKEAALARAEACLTLIGSENGLALNGLCQLNGADGAALAADETDFSKAVITDENGKFQVSMTYCDGAVLAAYAKSLAYGEAAYNGTVQLFEEDKEACEPLELLMKNASGVSGGHLLINGYVLSQHVED